jgi:hypothetical protein
MDETEPIRRQMIQDINAVPDSREALEQEHGQVWDTEQLSRDFQVKGFLAPFVSVVRKSDGAVGAMMFQHSPRYYFRFAVDEKEK